MNVRAVRMYCDRLEGIIESIAVEGETIADVEELNEYQADKLKALKQLYQDLNSIKRADNFFNN